MAPPEHSPDVLIAGAGIIGLSLALELRRQGAVVTVLERSRAMGGASTAAAGMLAAEDPHNPAALHAFARSSLSLYPRFLDSIQALSQQPVPFQTSSTVQYLAGDKTERIAEHSLDPRQLASALLAAVRAASVRVLENTSIVAVRSTPSGVEAGTQNGDIFHAAHLVHAGGAWAAAILRGFAETIRPHKGQMLRVVMPGHAPLTEVHRAGHVYVVPRTCGPQTGTALVGATVEDAGFDLTTDPAQLQRLRAQAAALGRATAFAADAPLVEAWAGLRPGTPDDLPLIGRVREDDNTEWIATGHFRNGILLAPGTARALADLLAGCAPAVDLEPFDPARFSHLCGIGR